MAGRLQGYVTDKDTGVAITSFVIKIGTTPVFDSNSPSNPYAGTNYYYFPYAAGIYDMFCNSTGYREWSRTAAKQNAITIIENRTKLQNIRMS